MPKTFEDSKIKERLLLIEHELQKTLVEAASIYKNIILKSLDSSGGDINQQTYYNETYVALRAKIASLEIDARILKEMMNE